MAYKNEQSVINLTPKFRHLVPSRIYININNPFIHGTLMMEKYIIDQIGVMMRDLFIHKITNFFMI